MRPRVCVCVCVCDSLKVIDKVMQMFANLLWLNQRADVVISAGTSCNSMGDNVVINTECEGVCYRIYARQKFQIMPERRQAYIL